MSEVVNLNKARKARARADAKAQAAENRVKHGRTKAEVSAEEAKAARRDALLDGARRERGTDPSPDQDD
jgi:hypothetical protein